MIGIAGGSASGKTTFARSVAKAAGSEQAIILELDRFYRPLRPDANEADFNFDEPSAIDFALVESVISQLLKNGYADAPVYDFATHDRKGYKPFFAAPLVIVEGLLALWHEPLRELLHFKLFVDAPDHVRFERRLDRDIRERGRGRESVERQWRTTVLPMHHCYVEPTKMHADRLVDGQGDLDQTALSVFGQYLQ